MTTSPFRLAAGACCAVLPLLASCGRPGTAPSNTTFRDSAGIRIADNYSLDAVPIVSPSGPHLVIGHIDGEEQYQLFDVGGVARLADGSVVVVTGGKEIRWFDSQGRFQYQSGRSGGGPGEFGRIRYMRALVGDSLLVFDSENRRVSILGSDGALGREGSIGLGSEQTVTVAAALQDGTLLARTTHDPPLTSTPLYRVGMGYTIIRADSVVALATYQGPEAALHVDNGGGLESVFVSVLPFARAVFAAAGQGQFFIGSSDSYRIDVWSDVGDLVRIIRVAAPVRPVTQAVRQEYVAAEITSMRRLAAERGQDFDEAEARRRLAEQAYAPAIPAYSALLGTADGGLWVREYSARTSDPISERWSIFDAAGRLNARVDMPPGFTPLYVEEPDVLGVFRDALDVPYVHGYTLRR